jgi:hypothetical protein
MTLALAEVEKNIKNVVDKNKWSKKVPFNCKTTSRPNPQDV